MCAAIEILHLIVHSNPFPVCCRVQHAILCAGCSHRSSVILSWVTEALSEGSINLCTSLGDVCHFAVVCPKMEAAVAVGAQVLSACQDAHSKQAMTAAMYQGWANWADRLGQPKVGVMHT